MEWFLENFNYVLLVLVIVVTTLASVNLFVSRRLTTYFTNSKFKVTAAYVIEPSTKEKFVNLTIFNNNLNDARVTAFGFVYEKQNIDYFPSYLRAKHLDENLKITIAARDSLVVKVKMDELVTTLVDLNKGRFKVKPLQAFITDSLGLMVSVPSADVRVHVQREMNQLAISERLRKKQIHREHLDAKRLKAIEKRDARRKARHEWWEKKRLEFKTIFTKKKS